MPFICGIFQSEITIQISEWCCSKYPRARKVLSKPIVFRFAERSASVNSCTKSDSSSTMATMFIQKIVFNQMYNSNIGFLKEEIEFLQMFSKIDGTMTYRKQIK